MGSEKLRRGSMHKHIRTHTRTHVHLPHLLCEFLVSVNERMKRKIKNFTMKLIQIGKYENV